MSRILSEMFPDEFANPLAGSGILLALATTPREKLAEVDNPSKLHPWREGLKSLGAGTAGMIVGSGLGLGAAYMSKELYQKRFGSPIPRGIIVPAAAVVGVGAGLAGMELRRRQVKAVQDAIESRKHSQ